MLGTISRIKHHTFGLPFKCGLVLLSLVMLLSFTAPAEVKADVATTTTVIRPVADSYNNWLVKPGTGVGQAWTAIDDDVSEPDVCTCHRLDLGRRDGPRCRSCDGLPCFWRHAAGERC